MTSRPSVALELDDIQAGAFRSRPSPYVGTYILVRIDNRDAGRELLRRLLPHLASAADPADSEKQAWLNASLTFQGLKVLGVPPDSLASFPAEFQEGMAARAAYLGDTGESGPENWEPPLGSTDVHLALAGLSPDEARLDAALARADAALRTLPGVEPIWRQDVYALPNERTSFGFKDGISHPAVEGSGIEGSNPHERPLAPGEIVLGYPDETDETPPMPQPDALGRNGTFIAFRKLHTRVAEYRQYLRARAASPAEEEWLAAKLVGRWPSGAPLALSPNQDDPELGADPTRNNAFGYVDDPRGLKCPLGAHARRANARDSIVQGEVRLHRMIRRGTSYGSMLAPGVLEDDGADRGIMFAFVGAHLGRQYEFVKTQWINDGVFYGAPGQRDPLVGPNDGSGRFTIPERPIRRQLQDLPRFVVTRGGEYCFMPGLRALRWIADLET